MLFVKSAQALSVPDSQGSCDLFLDCVDDRVEELTKIVAIR